MIVSDLLPFLRAKFGQTRGTGRFLCLLLLSHGAKNLCVHVAVALSSLSNSTSVKVSW